MNTEDTRNLFLAIALSVLVMAAWQYFYAGPTYQREHQAQLQANNPVPKTETQPSVASGQTESAAVLPHGAPAAPPASREETVSQALTASPRVIIDTPSLGGSIDLKGGQLDDLVLKDYRETIDKKSPLIRLFSPSGAPNAYFAETGFVSGSGVKTPNRETVWTADVKTLTPDQPVTLTWDNGAGLVFKRVIAVDDKYMFTITDSVANSSGVTATLQPYGLVLRHGMPQVAGYSVLHEGFEGVIGDQEHAPTYASIDKATGKAEAYKGDGGWLGFTDKYWASAMIPGQAAPIEARYSASGAGQPVDYQADFLGAEKTIAPGESYANTTRVFAGAKEVSTIYDYQSKYGIHKFNLMIDWGWFYFITQPMYWLIDAIYKYVGNFGLAILIVTVLVKLAFFPLANRSYQSMAKMKKIQPQIAALKDLYPDDKVKQQQEQMELFKREGVNPVAGCLPMVIQIPVFFALYKVIFITIEMRHAPFFGWIKDLSAPDPTNVFTLFGLIPWDPTVLPIFGHFLALGIWPLIMGVSMFFQMKMNPEPADPVQKSMFAWMPVIFTFMLGTFPAGLVIYWTWNNTLTVIQQYYIMSKAGVKVELWDNLKTFFARLKALFPWLKPLFARAAEPWDTLFARRLAAVEGPGTALLAEGEPQAGRSRSEIEILSNTAGLMANQSGDEFRRLIRRVLAIGAAIGWLSAAYVWLQASRTESRITESLHTANQARESLAADLQSLQRTARATGDLKGQASDAEKGLSDALAARASAQNELADLSKQIGDAKSAISHADEEASAKARYLQVVEARIRDESDRGAAMQSQYQALLAEQKRLQSEIDAAHVALGLAQADAATAQKKFEDLHGEISAAKAEFNAIQLQTPPTKSEIDPSSGLSASP